MDPQSGWPWSIIHILNRLFWHISQRKFGIVNLPTWKSRLFFPILKHWYWNGQNMLSNVPIVMPFINFTDQLSRYTLLHYFYAYSVFNCIIPIGLIFLGWCQFVVACAPWNSHYPIPSLSLTMIYLILSYMIHNAHFNDSNVSIFLPWYCVIQLEVWLKKCKSRLAHDTPYTNLTGELMGVYYEDFRERRSRYNGIALWYGVTLCYVSVPIILCYLTTKCMVYIMGYNGDSG